MSHQTRLATPGLHDSFPTACTITCALIIVTAALT